jgi:integrase
MFHVNNHKTVQERHKFADIQIAKVNELLAAGFYFDDAKRVEEKKKSMLEMGMIKLSAKQALREMHDSTKGAYRKKTKSSYESKLKSLINYLDKRLPDIGIVDFTPTHARGFVTYLIEVEKNGNKTINSKVGYNRGLFEKLKDDNVIKTNPFDKLKRLPEVNSTLHEVFTDKQIEKVKNYLIEHDLQLWHYIQFIFYCYIRPKELRNLKVKHFFVKERKILIPASESKSKRDDYVYMPERISTIIKEMQIDNVSGNNYLFSTDGYGGTKGLSTNGMYNRHKKMLEELEINGDFTLYSWKHTGVVKAYKKGIDIKAIQRQCRHSSIEMTDKYMRSLGFGKNEGFASKIDEIEI